MKSYRQTSFGQESSGPHTHRRRLYLRQDRLEAFIEVVGMSLKLAGQEKARGLQGAAPTDTDRGALRRGTALGPERQFLDRRYVLLRRTKNGDPRQVKLHPTLLEAVWEQVTVLWPGPDDRLLFEIETRRGHRTIVSHVIGHHAFASRLLNAGGSTIGS